MTSLYAVVETPSYLRHADEAGMTAKEQEEAIRTVAQNPLAGDLMEGTGGCRKFRLAGRGKGKSGGFRVVYVYVGDDLPVFILTVFGKGEKSNLTRAQRNALAMLVETLRTTYQGKVIRIKNARR